MMLNSTSTGAVCFNASSQAPSSSGKIMAASCTSHGRHYAPDVSRGLRDSARPTPQMRSGVGSTDPLCQRFVVFFARRNVLVYGG
jgi:hypothetical protein